MEMSVSLLYLPAASSAPATVSF